MTVPQDDRAARYRDLLNANPALYEALPAKEQRIAEKVASGEPVAFVANDESMSEGAIWHLLEMLARNAEGQPPVHPVETGGLGSDTDPGVTGGYGETGFGSLSSDNEYMNENESDTDTEPPNDRKS